MSDEATLAAAESRPGPLVIINGFGAPNLAADIYGLYFRNQGFQVYVVPQRFFNSADIRASARLVRDTVDRARRETGAARVGLVGVSLGGLIGLYYVKAGLGGNTVACFVSVGGPLNGSPVAHLSALPVFKHIAAIRQARPGSPLLEQLHRLDYPPDVRLYTMGATGDTITSREQWDVPGMTTVRSPHGIFPVGHWCLYFDVRNLRIVRDLLLGQETAVPGLGG